MEKEFCAVSLDKKIIIIIKKKGGDEGGGREKKGRDEIEKESCLLQLSVA